jgi:hypothetical protein
MKFSSSRYWKKKAVCCEFIEVLEVVLDTGFVAEVKVSYNEQLHRSWKTLVKNDYFRIGTKDYDKWQTYTPRGNRE